MNGARDYRLMKRKMVDAVLGMSEYNRFSKGIFEWVGFRTKWLEFQNVGRCAGQTKWSVRKLFTYSLEGITGFSVAPLSLASIVGVCFCVISFLMILVIVVRTLIWGDPVSGWPSLACIIFMVSGIQLFCTGIVGEYLSKTYLETKHRPIFILKDSSDERKETGMRRLLYRRTQNRQEKIPKQIGHEKQNRRGYLYKCPYGVQRIVVYSFLCIFSIGFCYLFCLRSGVFGAKVDWISQHSVLPDYFRQQFYDTGNLFPEFAANIGGGQNIYNFAYYGLYNPVLLPSYLLPFVKISDYMMAVQLLCLIASVILMYEWLRKEDFRGASVLVWRYIFCLQGQ